MPHAHSTHQRVIAGRPDNITYKSRLTPKKMAQKTMLYLASMGKTELSHDIFFKFSVEPFELFEVESQKKLNFET